MRLPAIALSVLLALVLAACSTGVEAPPTTPTNTVCTDVFCLEVPEGWGDEVSDTFLAFNHEVAPEATFLTANAYLGCWGIVDALENGADIVVTGRVTDAAVVCGPAAWHHGWSRTDWNELAGAVAAGHVIECSSQATGGNYSFFDEVPHIERVGFPWAEIAADGSLYVLADEGPLLKLSPADGPRAASR